MRHSKELDDPLTVERLISWAIQPVSTASTGTDGSCGEPIRAI